MIFHIDFNSYFATVEQQANPRLRGKPIGVTGGDRIKRTVVGAASVEAKRFGVRTGMQLWEAKKLCPEIILVPGDSDKYLELTKRFLNILKDYSPIVEVFSIDECFLEIKDQSTDYGLPTTAVTIAESIKQRIHDEVGEWIQCSIGISYNKFMAKLAGSLYKPNGLVAILDLQAGQFILDRVELNDVCGIGYRIKKRLNDMGIFNFVDLRKVPKESLLASFKSYGETLYNMARGEDQTKLVTFYEKEEVKSIGHRHTTDKDTADETEIKQIFLKLTELIARRLRAKGLVGKTVHVYFRDALDYSNYFSEVKPHFTGDGMQLTILPTCDGLEIFQTAWQGFLKMWRQERIRMIGVSVSNLQPKTPQNLTFLEEKNRTETIIKALDKINNKYGEFTLQRGILLQSTHISRKANSFLADRRFKL